MSTEQPEFKYGPIEFLFKKDYGNIKIGYKIVPEGYLVQELKEPARIYMFENFAQIDDYFQDEGFKASKYKQGKLW